ncbi:ATP-binding protein [Pseudomonadota bacterium]
MSSYARALRIGHLDTELKLDRSTLPEKRQDDLDEVVDAFNDMRRNLQQDIALREQIEIELRRHRDELDVLVAQRTEELAGKNLQFEIIGRLQSQFIREPEPTVMFDSLLKDIIALTGSAFGFIGDVLHDEDGSLYLKSYAFSNIAWDDETRRFYEENKPTGFVFKKLDNLFGHVVTSGQVVIANDPTHDPRGHGVPPGHPKLESFCGIPVYYGEQLVGMIGLANRTGGYDEALLSQLQPIVDTCGRIIDARWERNARIEAEQGLKQMRRYLQSVIDFMPSALIGLGPDHRVTEWNKEAEAITGLTAAEALGQNIDSVLSLPAEQMLQIYEAITDQRRLHIEQLQQNVGDGRRILNVVVYPLGKETDDVVLRLDDVTERVHLEMMMLQSEKMMSVGGLAAGMAHELNNPLGGILLGLQNIKRRLSPDMEKNLRIAEELDFDLRKAQAYFDKRGISQFVTGIIEAGERAAGIVNNMLNFTRKPNYRFEPESITPLIEEVIALAEIDYDLKKKQDFRNIKIVRDYADGVLAVPCIKSEIQQVLLNLLRNSAQVLATQDRVPRITLRSFLSGDEVCIEVEDNGPGMDEEIYKRVFEPFFTTKPPGQGTGLGLSVSYTIIHDEHHGDINVRSTPGEGTTFRISLPLKQETAVERSNQ